MQATRAIIKTKKDESAGKLLMKLDQMGVTARITKNEPEAIVLAEGQIDEGEIKKHARSRPTDQSKGTFSLGQQGVEQKRQHSRDSSRHSSRGRKRSYHSGPLAQSKGKNRS